MGRMAPSVNLPGFHGGAFVYVYVEDTPARDLTRDCREADCNCRPRNFEPRMELEIADCERTIRLSFDIDTPAGRVPPAKLAEVQPLLAEPPKGRYYRSQ